MKANCMKATAQRMREEMDVHCCNGINSIEIVMKGRLQDHRCLF